MSCLQYYTKMAQNKTISSRPHLLPDSATESKRTFYTHTDHGNHGNHDFCQMTSFFSQNGMILHHLQEFGIVNQRKLKSVV